MADDPREPGVQDRYRAFVGEPRAFRSRRANRIAALALLVGILVVIVLLALFS